MVIEGKGMNYMKIGIPRSLLYYYYYPFWQSLFPKLGCQIVLSDTTNTDILDIGVKDTISEICVPIKVYVGHVLNLLEKGVDYIYIPRLVSIRKGVTLCPKFLGLPDLIKNSLPGISDKVLTHKINSNTDDISDYKNYSDFTKIFDISKSELKAALRTAGKDWLKFRDLQKKGYKTEMLLEGKKEMREDGDL